MGLLLASATTLEGMQEAKQEDPVLEDLISTPEHLMVYLLEYFMAVKIQETDHLDKTKEDLLEHPMDQMEGLQEIKEAQGLAMVPNLLHLLVVSIHLMGSLSQPLVDLVAM